MTADQPTIVATSTGFRHTGFGEREWRLGPTYRYVADLAHAGPSPEVCVVGTALGDDPTFLASVYGAFGRAGWRTTHLSLFPEPSTGDVEGLLREQDVVWVAGGSVANLLVLWELHGLGPMLERCWRAGVVLTGVSAGALCWFTGGTTDSFGLPLRTVTNGLGFLPYSHSAHHDAEAGRRPTMLRLLAEGALPECYATDNGAAVTFLGTTFHEAVTETAGARAWHLTRRDDGSVDEQALPTRLLADT